MGCNCKRVNSFEEEHGTEEYESTIGKFYRNIWRVAFFLITIALAVIVIPFIIFAAIYEIFWGNNKITLPKFMRKYLE